MATVIIVIHLMVVLAMIGLILLQRSEGGALGIGGGSGAFLSGRGAGNVLSHTTAYLAIAFFATSLGLALLGRYESRPSDILERLPGQAAPVTEGQAPPVSGGETPATAEDLLRQLGGAGGPQTPPSSGATEPAVPSAPTAETPALPEPTDVAPVPTQPAPAPSGAAPGPQAPPANP
jgi:preprotein translocase subunit SecG